MNKIEMNDRKIVLDKTNTDEINSLINMGYTEIYANIIEGRILTPSVIDNLIIEKE